MARSDKEPDFSNLGDYQQKERGKRKQRRDTEAKARAERREREAREEGEKEFPPELLLDALRQREKLSQEAAAKRKQEQDVLATVASEAEQAKQDLLPEEAAELDALMQELRGTVTDDLAAKEKSVRDDILLVDDDIISQVQERIDSGQASEEEKSIYELYQSWRPELLAKFEQFEAEKSQIAAGAAAQAEQEEVLAKPEVQVGESGERVAPSVESTSRQAEGISSDLPPSLDVPSGVAPEATATTGQQTENSETGPDVSLYKEVDKRFLTEAIERLKKELEILNEQESAASKEFDEAKTKRARYHGVRGGVRRLFTAEAAAKAEDDYDKAKSQLEEIVGKEAALKQELESKESGLRALLAEEKVEKPGLDGLKTEGPPTAQGTVAPGPETAPSPSQPAPAEGEPQQTSPEQPRQTPQTESEAQPTDTAEQTTEQAIKERLDKARKAFAEAEKKDKKYKNTDEYKAIEKEYREARAEVVAGKAEKIVEERLALVNAEAEEKKKGWYETSSWTKWWKQLGEANLYNFKSLGQKLSFDIKEDQAKITMGIKRTLNFGSHAILKFASARTLLGGAMLGLGFGGVAIGGTAAAAGGIMLGARRALAGMGTSIGTYEGLQSLTDAWGRHFGKRKELTADVVEKMQPGEIVERMAHFETMAKLGRIKIEENPTYDILIKNLQKKLETTPEMAAETSEEAKYKRISDALDLQLQQVDARVEKLARRAKLKNYSLGTVSMAAGSAVGGWGYLRDHFWGKEVPTSAGSIKAPVSGETSEKNIMPGSPKGPLSEQAIGEKGGGGWQDAGGGRERPKIITSKPETIEAPPPTHIDYQGGRSVWAEAQKQYAARFGEKFGKLGEAEKTWDIDLIKDKIAANPQEYGLAEGVDMDTLTKEQLQGIKWDKLFGAIKPDILDPHLTQTQIHSIIEHNQEISEWVKAHPGERLTSERVEEILRGGHEEAVSRVESAATTTGVAPKIDATHDSTATATSGAPAGPDLKELMRHDPALETLQTDLSNADISGEKLSLDLKQLLTQSYQLNEKQASGFMANLAGADGELTRGDLVGSGLYDEAAHEFNCDKFEGWVDEFSAHGVFEPVSPPRLDLPPEKTGGGGKGPGQFKTEAAGQDATVMHGKKPEPFKAPKQDIIEPEQKSAGQAAKIIETKDGGVKFSVKSKVFELTRDDAGKIDSFMRQMAEGYLKDNKMIHQVAEALGANDTAARESLQMVLEAKFEKLPQLNLAQLQQYEKINDLVIKNLDPDQQSPATINRMVKLGGYVKQLIEAKLNGAAPAK